MIATARTAYFEKTPPVLLVLILCLLLATSAEALTTHPRKRTASPQRGKPTTTHKLRAHTQSSAAHQSHSKTRVPTRAELHRYTTPHTPQAPAELTPSYAVSPPPEVTPTGNAHDPLALLPPAPAHPFLYPQALAPFFQALAAQQSQRANPAADPDAKSSVPQLADTVRVLQFGDSHTAADIFTGDVRAHLQAHFGNGGLGFQYPGHPFAGYHLAGSARSQTPGWTTEGNHFTQLGNGELGLGGISLSTSRPGEAITLSTTCTTLQVEYLRQPGGGRMQLTVDSIPVSEIDTGSGITGTDPAGTLTYSCTPGFHDIELTTLDRAPVRLFGLVTEQPGVTYECLGLNGAVAPLILRWNQPIFADYLRQRDPALIVLAYGTNEAVYISTHTEEYTAQFHRILALLHQVVPSASILVLGPYDRAVRTAGYTVGRGRHRHTVSSWQTFSGTERINQIQREACQTGECAFYDEQARMGGPGAMLRWASGGLAQPDHTHLTGAGYRTLADALYADLLAAYTRYGQTATTQPSNPASSPSTQ